MVFLSLCLSLSGILSVLLLFAFRFFGVCSSSIVRLLFGVGFSLPSVSLSPRGTKESIAAGHTGGMEAVLLFRPWCLLCKIGGGGCY